RNAFLRELLQRLPSWKSYVSENVQTHGLIEVPAPNRDDRPFTVDIRDDTVTVHPFCAFGFDYVFTCTSEDLEQKPHLVFKKLVSEIADFASGATVVAIRRQKWLFMKAGWNVRFVPTLDADKARRIGASIVAWPSKD